MKLRLATASVESSSSDNQTPAAHRISGKTADNEVGLMEKDAFHPVHD